MKKYLIAALLLCNLASFSQTNAYEKAWNLLNENKRAEAEKFLTEAMADPATASDAYITNIYLQSYNGKEKNIKDFANSFYSKTQNPYPYIYALWFNDAVLGAYGKKTSDSQVKLMDQLVKDPNAQGSLVAAANYQEEFHYLFSAEFDKTQNYSNNIGNIRNWQFTGPFENLSQSGFYKEYGPLEHPEPGATFTSLTNADVKWFTPAEEIKDGWIPSTFQFNKRVAVIYAQSFVSSSSDQSVFCNVGCTGSIKVWINDVPVIAESRERITELDAYTVKCNLKKGINRVLIQLGYTNYDYPNFSLRFTDEKYKALPNIYGSSTYMPYPKNNDSSIKYTIIRPFAEEYFAGKIKSQPGNLVNYLLLADACLRNGKLLEARDVINDALKMAPENSLVRMKLVNILNQQNNKTLYLEELEKVKLADAESMLVSQLKMKEFYDNEKFEECAAELDRYKGLYGEDEYVDGYNLMLLAHDKKYDDLVKVAEKVYAKYPGNAQTIAMMYNIKKDVYKDNSGALAVYEKYMKNNYNYDVYTDYANILVDKGDVKKGMAIKEKLSSTFPYDPNGYYKLSKYYFSVKDYNKSEDYVRKSLALSPYNENYWEQLGDIHSEKNNTSEALNDYNQSLKFDPDQYTIISKIRKLNNKPEISKLFPETDIEKIIKEDNPADAKNSDYGYYYILDQKNAIMYPDGATEEYDTYMIRITNDKGVEAYKESSINYNNSQSLLIEKTVVIKKSGVKIEGERNDNQIVFTNLEVGDVIVFKYRLQTYAYGRFAKEYWDRYAFGGQIYSAITKYNLIVPAEQKINYILTNSPIQPVIQNIENFKEYSWVIAKPVPTKDEPLMPGQVDIGTVLHISTISSWKEIANWYSDITNNKSEEDFEIISLYKKLFPDDKKKLSQFEKARIIYSYIEANIKYSEVSFRQSAFVPQRASAVLSTRLGDCKDLSGLFVTLAHMAGINAKMVLVSTRDNGQKNILLPSVDFNHCIVKAVLDNKDHFIELTDNYLPFTSMPNNLSGAQALEIPNKPANENAELIHLKPENRIKDVIKRVVDIKPEDGDLHISVATVTYGATSSFTRDKYLHLDNDKQMQEMEKSIAGSYKNTVSLEKIEFKDLDKLNDSVTYSFSYKVKDEVATIGSLNTFRIVYPDIVASLDNFSASKRDYPVEYWNYENIDAYETTVTITAPKGNKFIELPKDEILSFKDMKYSIQYKLKSPDKLIVTRTFSNGRPQEILPEDYPAFKSFFEKIIKAEQKYIAYK